MYGFRLKKVNLPFRIDVSFSSKYRYLGSSSNVAVNRFLNTILTGLLIFRSPENTIWKMAKHSLAMPRYHILKLTVTDYGIRDHLVWNFLWF